MREELQTKLEDNGKGGGAESTEGRGTEGRKARGKRRKRGRKGRSSEYQNPK